MVDFGLPRGLSELLGGLIESPDVVAGAMRRFHDEDFRGAADRLRVAIHQYTGEKEQARLTMILGYCELKLENYEDAESDLREATTVFASLGDEQLKPSLPSLFAMKHVMEVRDGELEAKRRTYSIVIALDQPETRARAMVNQGDLYYFREGRQEEARALWEKAYSVAEDDEDKAYATYNLGWYWHEHSDQDRAVAYYEETIDLAPESVAADYARRGLIK
jgi:tetratricopeptide (TPR) repeat protein